MRYLTNDDFAFCVVVACKPVMLSSRDRCVFNAADFYKAKEIADGSLQALKQNTSCYSATWSVDHSKLIREEVSHDLFVVCMVPPFDSLVTINPDP